MNHYLKELQRQPYYSSGRTIAIPRSLQQKLAFDAAAVFEAEQRTLLEKRKAEYDMLEKHGGDLSSGDFNKRNDSTPTNTYVQPDGVSFYFQPDGVSYYLQP